MDEAGTVTIPSTAPAIAAVGVALPPHRYQQQEILQAVQQIWREHAAEIRRLGSLHEHTLVDARHFALPLEQYAELTSFGRANDAWIRVARELGARAITDALAQAGFAPRDIDAMFTVSVTGICSPSLDALLSNDLGLRPDLKRTPIFGLGCAGGAAGIARAADYLRGDPDGVAVLLSVELCTLNFQRDDLSVAHQIATGLFGDGAAAVVLVGARRARTQQPRVVATRARLYPDTEELMGWRIDERGFRIQLLAAVPDVARTRLPADVDGFLAEHGLQRADIAAWIGHPGGPRVLEAMQEGLGLSREQLRHAWDVLRDTGNLSSTSVLLVLARVLAERAWPPGAPALLFALGPGFCAELALLRRS